MSVGEAVETEPRRRRPGRAIRFALTITGVLLLLFGVPWWTLVGAGNDWPTGVFVTGTIVFAVALVSFPVLMFLGHGPRHRDGPSVVADTTLGVIWVLFVWSIIGQLLVLVLTIAGVDAPARSRVATAAVLVISLVLLGWGTVEARRVPRVRRVEVVLPRLGAGLDGLRLVLLTDTHYGPIERSRWSRGVTEVVNTLDADVVAHTGDIADGEVAQRRSQAAPLADIRASMARVYVTGNHEYFSGAQRWVEHMAALGWEALHNRHVVVTRGGDSLVIAGVDDRTAAGSGVPGHHTDHEAALSGADPALPVLLLAHQPQQIQGAVAHGVDLQISGHTHGGQMWPFHYLVRLDQPVLQGLSRHSERTQLYTSRGTGFWGPPFRIFAPSEITLLTLRSA
ncbi:metallophosphoesterase [Paractinoplanes abujensis]|uniref:Putative MPP superfamily phosphohydrolase n=1 Tax=Paractinoplanes abujensis TaxID=882441 RepID=A0A7W7FY07_9ACTN|nr:metallophosphoesterase [Actinoplanes abujensis]MBB4690488.1 putative MPP superfamily phosphohydrolase [Actinoplanes abujensis]GID21253.1 metallophosphoesterase [Actinoplanes abujensis]